jgi:hypothetical protein
MAAGKQYPNAVFAFLSHFSYLGIEIHGKARKTDV